MKNDMRITYPLWQMGVIVIAMLLTWLVGLSSVFTVGDRTLEVNIQGEWGVVWGVALLVFVFYLALFTWNVAKHNKRMPNHKINVFSWKPQEYMEDDELFQEFTKRATKNVYTYFVWSIPLFAGLSLGLQLGTIGMIMGLLLLSLGQYLIYYTQIKKYVEVDE
ncbi:MAG TPA: hypothetical protein K8V56_06585 [Sporosarcina psychrophila]|uniref:DUF3169 domain-containing protein n=1 Tax=Sporosarcina psychrophila TaxID=1476 RepID=A0A921FX93_SPOPS|nr:hypothetical protein [Sporosarcina psychrophila]